LSNKSIHYSVIEDIAFEVVSLRFVNMKIEKQKVSAFLYRKYIIVLLLLFVQLLSVKILPE